MSRTSGPATRAFIISKAFVLFGTRQYDNVTFQDLEGATGLTRGAMVYHFRNKQDLFNAVVENKLLSGRTEVLGFPVREKNILRSFIDDFVESCEDQRKSMVELGIKNIGLAYHIIECSALCFFEDYGRRFRQVRDMELGILTQTVMRAMEKGEITDKVKPRDLALLLMNQYAGHFYTATKEGNVNNSEQLRKELLAIYDIIKK